MRFTTFRTSVLGVLAVAAVGSFFFLVNKRAEKLALPGDMDLGPDELALPDVTAVPAPDGWMSPVYMPDPTKPNHLTELQRRILEKVREPARVSSLPDAFPALAERVDFADPRRGFFSVIKLDLDRNHVWDEEWEMSSGKLVQRKLLDGKAVQEYLGLRQGDWLRVSEMEAQDKAAEEAQAAASKAEAASQLKDYEREALELVSRRATGPKVKDALKGRAVKVNLYAEDNSGYYNRAKLDYDRDEKWDEKWELKDGKLLKRFISSRDDDQYDEEYTLEGDRWARVGGGTEGAGASAGTGAAMNLASGEQGLREVDRAVFSLLSARASEPKVKDAIKGPIKVNLYHDDNSGFFNRVKLDYDRDEKWDEKWEVRSGKVEKRFVSSKDDEKYDTEYRLEGEKWMPAGGAAASADPLSKPLIEQPTTGGGGTLRQIDGQILVLVSQPASSEKVKDAIPGPMKVNLYHDDRSGYYNRLKIDYDKDEKWDEKWTLSKGQVVKRQVAPNDDEAYTEEYTLDGRRWVKAK